jgi:uncharacterized protein (DUF2062 family)
MGATPRSLAWSIAVGLVVGINPILGSTTVLCLALAFALRLNPVASQIANHAAFPLQLAFVLPFLRLGSWLFHIPPVPLSPAGLLRQARAEPLALARQLWLWESRAFLLWLALSLVAAPLLALALTPVLRRLLGRIQRHKYPALPHL